MLEYKLPQLTLIREVPVSIGAEGWGLAASPDKSVLYVTDSKDDLYHVDPATYKVLRKLKIKDPQLGKTIIGVNELEMVEDFLGRGKPALLGNIYQTRLVLALRSERAQTLNERAAEAERESQRRRQRQLCLQQVRNQAPASKPPFLTAPHFHQKQRKPIYHFH